MSFEWASIIVTGLIALTVAIIKFVPRKNNPGHNSLNNKYVRKDMCAVTHKHIEDDLGEIKVDVKELLRRG